MDYNEILAEAFEDEMKKIASSKLAGLTPEQIKSLGLLGIGAAGFQVLRQANDDRKTGRAVRVQQGY